MDPTSIAAPLIEREFGYQSNKHLYDWITENETHSLEIQTVIRESDRNSSNKQYKVNARKETLGEIWDDLNRTYEARGNEIDGEIFKSKGTDTGSWMEDYITNETDPQIKLDKYDEMIQRSLDVSTES